MCEGKKNTGAKEQGGGKLLHGTASKAYRESLVKPVASIPSKFETVLYTGPREKKGFLVEERRFGEADTEVPGPGQYKYAPSPIFTKESIGTQGYGSLVSKTRRGTRTRYTGPGPGMYEAPTLAERPDFNRSNTTAPFHSPVKPAKLDTGDDQLPGPGAYRAEGATRTGQKLNWDGGRAYASSFKGTPHALALSAGKDSPPPNRYEFLDPWAANSPLNTASSRTPSRAGLSSFAGRSVSSSLGHVDPTIYLLDPKDVASRKPDTGPGPGSYESGEYGSVKSTIAKAVGRTGANFKEREYTDRFGAPLAAVLHDPDEARAMLESKVITRSAGAPRRLGSPTKGVVSAFKSEMPSRSDYNAQDIVGRCPGPAFYSPKPKPGRTSHHMNARKHMVG
ncbi:hypothetical protein FOA52_004767 [Chlamydomonas sp. UWO 241]|nr:hypothetical protein FOA52_004767 [Chlamydomonas sp. UWO 241]